MKAMKAMKLFLNFLLLILCTGCLFGGSDIIQIPVVNRYHINSLGNTNQLCYRGDNAVTEKIIFENIDSIGFNNEYIIVNDAGKYLVVNQATMNISEYADFKAFSRAVLHRDIKLKSIDSLKQIKHQ